MHSRRSSGALPPLHGCVKRIHGNRGTTEFPRAPGMPFEVRGLELHYRSPFGMLVDKLEPQTAVLPAAGALGRNGHHFGFGLEVAGSALALFPLGSAIFVVQGTDGSSLIITDGERR